MSTAAPASRAPGDAGAAAAGHDERRTARVRLAAALAATALSAVLYALAFPPRSWWPLAWVCLVPFFLALARVGVRGTLLLALVWTLVASSLVADALPGAVSGYFLRSSAFGWTFALGIWSFTGAVYYMAFAPAYRALALRTGAALPLLAGAAWAGCELLRGRLFTGSSLFVGNPWALAGYSQNDFAALMQIASVTGIYGVGFLIAAANAALAGLWQARRDARARRGAWLGLGSVALALLVTLGFGARELRRADAPHTGDPGIPVAVVQGNVDVGSVWRSDLYGRNLDVYLDLTVEALRKGRPEIVFWPEAALTFMLEEEPLYQRAIARVLALRGTQLVVGGPSIESSEPPRYRNSVFVMDPGGELRGRYDKEMIVPFSEYFPLPQLDFLRRRFERVRQFTPGERTEPLATRAGPLAVAICNEAMLPEVVGARVRAGASVLANPSNDSWIPGTKWADMMFDLVSVRAIEQRRYLVRASTAGPSAIVDPWGRTLARTEAFTRGVALARIRPRSELSLYGRVGDLFGFLCIASVAAALVASRGAGRSPQTTPSRASDQSAT